VYSLLTFDACTRWCVGRAEVVGRGADLSTLTHSVGKTFIAREPYVGLDFF